MFVIMVQMKILGLDHAQFIVKDLKESIDFFEKLGFKFERKTEHREGGSAEFRMFPGGPVFEIHQTERMENPGHDHYALLVDDLDAAVKELRQKGIKLEDPSEVKVTGRLITNFRDSSGFRWQLVAPKKK